MRINNKLLMERLEDRVAIICSIDPYIGCVAQAEINLRVQNLDDDVPIHFKIIQHEANFDEDASLNDNQKEQIKIGITLLEELIQKGPSRILASIKLWQFFRSRIFDKDRAL